MKFPNNCEMIMLTVIEKCTAHQYQICMQRRFSCKIQKTMRIIIEVYEIGCKLYVNRLMGIFHFVSCCWWLAFINHSLFPWPFRQLLKSTVYYYCDCYSIYTFIYFSEQSYMNFTPIQLFTSSRRYDTCYSGVSWCVAGLYPSTWWCLILRLQWLICVKLTLTGFFSPFLCDSKYWDSQ